MNFELYLESYEKKKKDTQCMLFILAVEIQRQKEIKECKFHLFSQMQYC